jgi:DUF1680 family protein
VAVMRGPVVYCAEFPKRDNGEQIWNDGVFLPENARLTPRQDKKLFGGVVLLKGQALTSKGRDMFVTRNTSAVASPASPDWAGQLYRKFTPRNVKSPNSGTMDVTLIPYFTWANRGPAFMTVWIPLAK